LYVADTVTVGCEPDRLKWSPDQLGFVHASVVHSYEPVVVGAVAEKLTEMEYPGSMQSLEWTAVASISPETSVTVQLFPEGAVTLKLEIEVKPEGMLTVAEPNLFPGGFEARSVIVTVYVWV
jgi:hypothetical protein